MRTVHPPITDRQKWLVLATVSTSVLLSTIDGSIVNVAFPTMVEELDTTFNVIQWVALGYLLTIATLTLGMGRLGDVVSKKKLYAAGFGAFTAASALCGLAPSVEWLIGFRILQAIGAVMVLALGSAILVESFPSHERGKALGWVMTAVSAGIITGPILGGLLISAFTWHAIFLVNIPIGIVGTWMAFRFIPDTAPVPGLRFDWAGAVLMGLSLFCLSLALTLAQDAGFAAPVVVAGLVVSALAAALFLIVELKAKHPMLDLHLFANPELTVGVSTGVITFVCLAATVILLPFYLTNVLGLDVLHVGLLLGVTPLTMGIVSPISGSLSDRIGVKAPIIIGLLVIAASYFALMTLDTDTEWWHFALIAVPYGFGIGLFQSPNNSAIMGSVSSEYLGVAGGLLQLTRLMGQVVGIAVLGSLWATRVAAELGGRLPSGGATDAPGAAQVAGLHYIFLISGVAMLAAVALAVWGLRHRGRLIRAEAPAR